MNDIEKLLLLEQTAFLSEAHKFVFYKTYGTNMPINVKNIEEYNALKEELNNKRKVETSRPVPIEEFSSKSSIYELYEPFIEEQNRSWMRVRRENLSSYKSMLKTEGISRAETTLREYLQFADYNDPADIEIVDEAWERFKTITQKYQDRGYKSITLGERNPDIYWEEDESECVGTEEESDWSEYNNYDYTFNDECGKQIIDKINTIAYKAIEIITNNISIQRETWDTRTIQMNTIIACHALGTIYSTLYYVIEFDENGFQKDSIFEDENMFSLVEATLDIVRNLISTTYKEYLKIAKLEPSWRVVIEPTLDALSYHVGRLCYEIISSVECELDEIDIDIEDFIENKIEEEENAGVIVNIIKRYKENRYQLEQRIKADIMNKITVDTTQLTLGV